MSNAVGRPTKLNPDVVGKLTAAFANGFTIEQACIYADIDKTTYYDWLKKNEQFSHDMEAAQGRLGLQARKVVADAINKGDVAAAFRWLEKRDPDFSAKGELTHKVDDVGNILKAIGILNDDDTINLSEEGEAAPGNTS